ncbi:hypothetical protein P4E94_15875 [Pontiellaceae bacterium B12219]|nr:hypothetical protein [Pontiellaceae bacterium B12219]
MSDRSGHTRKLRRVYQQVNHRNDALCGLTPLPLPGCPLFLAELKQDGKLIGVISHVSALKERIGTQVNVHTSSGGRSRLSGTGISAIS